MRLWFRSAGWWSFGMMGELLQFMARLYVDFITNHHNVILVGFISGFTILAFFLGFNREVLSRAAVRNTLATFAVLAFNVAMVPVVYFAANAMQAAYHGLGIPSVPQSFWSNWHWLAVAVLAFIVRDFADYWSHRAMHTRLGWPIHAVHHSDTHVNGFTIFRVHVLEVITMKAFHISFLSFLGIPAQTVAALHVLGSLHNAYVHFEVDIDHGPFNWLLASPRYHRWHHADFEPAYGKNLANTIPAWDMLFGTYYQAGACKEKMGAEKDGISGTDPARLILLPFLLWSRMAQEAFAAVLAKRTDLPSGSVLESRQDMNK